MNCAPRMGRQNRVIRDWWFVACCYQSQDTDCQAFGWGAKYGMYRFVLVPMCFLEYCFSSFVLVLERIQGIGISALANCEHAMLCDSGIHDRVLLCIGWWLQACSENCSKYFIVGTSEIRARHVWLLLTTSFILNMMSDTSWVRHMRLWVHSFLSGFYLLVWLELKWWLQSKWYCAVLCNFINQLLLRALEFQKHWYVHCS